jgi:hypothetical protein
LKVSVVARADEARNAEPKQASAATRPMRRTRFPCEGFLRTDARARPYSRNLALARIYKGITGRVETAAFHAKRRF